MPMLLVRHKVESYAKWRSVFDEDGHARVANGSRGERIFRSVDDPDDIFLVLEWDDIDRAGLFIKSNDLRDSMIRGGVIERPDIWLLSEPG